ncbi:MAG: AAA family ATPase [Candidatus Aenigmarchaeota archaeon]|nr:AAA family ATPase [Candidatus Aenigmarchaeota archaeon]
MPVERVESGIPGLDKLIEGGLVKNSINLVAGQTGTGKTLFCMQYLLHGLRKGESGLYITLEQSEDDVLQDVGRFGWDIELKKYMQSGKLLLVPLEPTGIRELTTSTVNNIKKVGAKRFVLDSLSVATMGWKTGEMDLSKIRAEIFAFMKSLKSLGVTSLLITEIPETDVKSLSRFGFEEFLSDSVVKLHYLEYAVGAFNRSLIIRKMRRTKHGADIYPMEIGGKGLELKLMKTVKDKPLNI